jgi:hypothetical protein
MILLPLSPEQVKLQICSSYYGQPCNYYIIYYLLHKVVMILFYFLWYWRLNSGPILEPLHQAFFVMGVFKIGSPELFTQAGFEP